MPHHIQSVSHSLLYANCLIWTDSPLFGFEGAEGVKQRAYAVPIYPAGAGTGSGSAPELQNHHVTIAHNYVTIRHCNVNDYVL